MIYGHMCLYLVFPLSIFLSFTVSIIRKNIIMCTSPSREIVTSWIKRSLSCFIFRVRKIVVKYIIVIYLWIIKKYSMKCILLVEQRGKNKLIKNNRHWEWKHARNARCFLFYLFFIIHDFCFQNLIIIRTKTNTHTLIAMYFFDGWMRAF